MAVPSEMEVQEVVVRLCRLAVDFYAGSKSMFQLLTESGVDRCPAALSVAYLSPYIAAHPEVIEGWLHHSQKPYTNTWHFERKKGGFVVRFAPDGERFEIADPALACAEFLVREVKSLLAASRNRLRPLIPEDRL